MTMTPDWRQIELETRNLSIRSAVFLGEGWASRAYLVNDKFVFRFPKRQGWDELHREMKFLAFAADHLPLAVPRYLHAAPNSPAAPHGYAVYQYLHGHAMDVSALSSEQRVVAADRIAAFIRAVHDLQPSPDVSEVLPREDERASAKILATRAEHEIAPKLRPPEADNLRRRFDEYLSTPRDVSLRPSVLHADLSRDHILMQDEAVVAVIDFGDVNWGDADYDFTYLFVECGLPFVEEVARRYEHPNLDRLRFKLNYFDMADQVDIILNGPGYALEGQEDQAWRRLKQLLGRSDPGL